MRNDVFAAAQSNYFGRHERNGGLVLFHSPCINNGAPEELLHIIIVMGKLAGANYLLTPSSSSLR